jgi:hypothetical protein
MDSVAFAADFPFSHYERGGLEREGIPDERHGDDAAVAQVHADGVVGELHIQHAPMRWLRSSSPSLRNNRAQPGPDRFTMGAVFDQRVNPC